MGTKVAMRCVITEVIVDIDKSGFSGAVLKKSFWKVTKWIMDTKLLTTFSRFFYLKEQQQNEITEQIQD